MVYIYIYTVYIYIVLVSVVATLAAIGLGRKLCRFDCLCNYLEVE